MVPVVAASQERRRRRAVHILRGHDAQRPLHLDLAHGVRQIERSGGKRLLRQIAEQLINARNANLREHVAAVGFGEG